MPEEAMLFTSRPGRWYAAEFIGDEFGADQELRSYSPIDIHEVIALKTGDGSIELAFAWALGFKSKLWE